MGRRKPKPRGGGYGLKVGQHGGLKPSRTRAPEAPATPPHLQAVWQRAAQLLASALSPSNLQTYVRPLALLELTDEVAVVATFDPFVRDHVQGAYTEQLTEALTAAAGHPVRVEVHLVDAGELATETSPIEGQPASQPLVEAGEGTPEPSLAPAPAQPSTRALWYMASPWCQVAPLPVQGGHSTWQAAQGHTSLEATARGGELPHGHLARRLLAHLCTRLVRSGQLHSLDAPSAPIRIADSVADLLRQLGIESDTGGERGTRTGVLRQLELLLETSWSITEGEGSTSFTLFDESWEQARPGRGQSIELTPTPEARAALAGRMVPVSQSAVVALGRDSTAVDLYLWATWRNGTGRRGDRHTIGPKGVSGQMGRRWQHTGAWMARIGAAVDRVRGVYGGLRALVARARGHVHRALTLVITEPDVALRSAAASTDPQGRSPVGGRIRGGAHPGSAPVTTGPRAPPATA